MERMPWDSNQKETYLMVSSFHLEWRGIVLTLMETCATMISMTTRRVKRKRMEDRL